VFYEKPLRKFERILATQLASFPYSARAFSRAMFLWLGDRLWMKDRIATDLGVDPDRILFTEHHESHAASAFYPSPFADAAILTIDGVGEWATTTIGVGQGNGIRILQELRFPHSLGLLYSAFTSYCGFRINSGEYKLMGLAPYGDPKFVDVIYAELLDLKSDGSFWLNLEYFDFLRGTTMTNAPFHTLFGGAPRKPDEKIVQRHMDIARSIQVVTEEVMLRLARHARALTGQKSLCLAGGVALNCVANGRILKDQIFEQLWIQPAAGDAGGALGAALAAWHQQGEAASANKPRLSTGKDGMQGALLGPSFSNEVIEQTLRSHGAVYQEFDQKTLLDRTVDLLNAEKVVGWFQGRMEWGARALGNRSILADPRRPDMRDRINEGADHLADGL
jgi:carbamoyltransferase